MTPYTLGRRLGAEFIATALLLATVIGSGIMSAKLSGGNQALALLGNTLPTGAILVVLITMFGPVSGAHLNPAVSGVFFARGDMGSFELVAYIVAQVCGGLAGVVAAHLMFDLPLIEHATKIRTGGSQFFSEGAATFGLVLTVLGTVTVRPSAVAVCVGLYITAAFWFTASTSFANPAVTIARAFSDTFAGIRFSDVTPFIGAQFVGALLAVLIAKWLFTPSVRSAALEADPVN